MPRETITKPEPRDTPNAEVVLGLSVGWNRAGWVQIYMEPAEAEHSGQWHICDVNRDAINRLIRALRKARDQAFGADA